MVKPALLFLATCTVCASPLLALGWMRDLYAQIHMFDTGIYLQLLNNLWNQGSWASSITGESNFLAHHFQPIIALLTPLVVIANRATSLFVISAASVLLAAWIILRFALREFAVSTVWQIGIVAAIWLHPSVANRIFHGFVPEILALAFYSFVAVQLAETRKPLFQINFAAILIAMLLAGICKESLWLSNIWLCALFAWQDHTRRKAWLAVGGACLAIFVFLFYSWMPAHSNMPNYYGLRYFVDASAASSGPGTIIHSLISNLFSLSTLTTILFSIAGPLLFLPFLFPNIVTLAALPTILLILCTRSFQHVIENHYLIAALPFLWVGAIINVARSNLASPKLHFYLGVLFALVPACVLVFSGNGILNSLARLTRSPALAHIRPDMEKIAAQLTEESYIVADGTIQPTIPAQKNIKDILSFVGNPNPFNDVDKDKVSDVITFAKYDTMEICDELKNLTEIPSNLNLAETIATCGWLVNVAKTTTYYENSKLYHYRIERK